MFPRRILDGIADGSVTVAFRRWDKPRARAGGRQRTRVGVVAFDAVEPVDPAALTDDDARAAGIASREALLAVLDKRGTEAGVWRVAVRLAGPDPRVALRDAADLDAATVGELQARLARFDRASRGGPWTETVLRLIAERPGVRAPDLAASLGRETLPFKRDVRKLKELGLTESLTVGYRLSPRGRALLDRL
jgi:hypothetical protein